MARYCSLDGGCDVKAKRLAKQLWGIEFTRLDGTRELRQWDGSTEWLNHSRKEARLDRQFIIRHSHQFNGPNRIYRSARVVKLRVTVDIVE